MNLRSGHESTNARAGHDLEGHGENGRENANGESHGALLAFLNSITKNKITPTNSNNTRNDMVIINLSLLQ
jgi:hypothetical protein